MFNKSKLFFWTMEILGLVLVFFLLTQVSFVFKPIFTLFSSLFIPVLLAIFLYYIFDPIIRFFERKIKLPRMLGIVITILFVIGAYVGIFASVIPAIVSQLSSFINTTIKAYPNIQQWVINIANSDQFNQISEQINFQSMFSNFSDSYTSILQNILNSVTLSLNSIIGFIVQFLFILTLVPIFLYYLLKDGKKILPFIQHNILREDKYGISKLLSNMNAAMSRYIFGLAVDVVFIFVTVLVGYLIMGIPYAFLFSLFSAVMTLIPYLGPYIGVLPVILMIAWTQPWLALIAVIYVLVIQQLDGSIIYPKIVGSTMHVHPVTVMLLMFMMGSLFGLSGMVIAVPGYAIVKEIVKFIAGLYQNIKISRKLKDKKEAVTK